MLIVGHIGYTVGATWALDSASPGQAHRDFRVVAAMGLAPDIIDRALFVFALPTAASGRLIAHTLIFQAAFLLAVILVHRGWWLYGAASLFHLALDTSRLSTVWFRHLLWPLLGADQEFVNILPYGPPVALPYSDRVLDRAQEVALAYGGAPWWTISLELGGAIVLAAFVYRKRLYTRLGMRAFLTTGKATEVQRQATGAEP